MKRTTERAGAEFVCAGTMPIQDGPVRKLMQGVLSPSEMTREERMDGAGVDSGHGISENSMWSRLPAGLISTRFILEEPPIDSTVEG